MMQDPRITQYNAAGVALGVAVEGVRKASASQLPTAEQVFRDAQAEFTRTEANLRVAEDAAAVPAFVARTQGNPNELGMTPGSDNGGDADNTSFRSFGPGESIAEAMIRSRQAAGTLEDGSDKLNLGRALRAMALGDWRGAEAEYRAMNGTTAGAGGALIPELLAARFIDRARAASVVTKAGVGTISMEDDYKGHSLSIARVVTDPTLAWLGEGDTITPSAPTFDAVNIAAKKLACIIRVSREILLDAPNADQLLSQVLVNAFAAEMDRVYLEGSGLGDEPLGLAHMVGIGEVEMAVNGAAPTNDTGPAKLAATSLLVRGANYAPSALISSPRDWDLFHLLKDVQKQPLKFGAGLDDLPWLQTTNASGALTHGTGTATGNVYAGQFNMSNFYMRQNIEIFVSRDAGLGTDEIVILATVRMDTAVDAGGAFARLVGIKAS